VVQGQEGPPHTSHCLFAFHGFQPVQAVHLALTRALRWDAGRSGSDRDAGVGGGGLILITNGRSYHLSWSARAIVWHKEEQICRRQAHNSAHSAYHRWRGGMLGKALNMGESENVRTLLEDWTFQNLRHFGLRIEG
jgi:hypothetical protein